ncbi:MAG TPA: hypothetical protein PLQ82_00730 [Desulfobacteraceae bacterium]|nr:hypothetical protein [Desulfobacteraceae bacterium]HPQ26969.1 hypothetical protein [Desulfobacteraceae bacterium]
MPLAFNSISHGTIAFGFFNIESDMLLLGHYFIFADDFCETISSIAENSADYTYEAYCEGYQISDPEDTGDLMAAIHDIHYTGFIGDVYRKFPFPENQEGFKQKPYGSRNRDIMVALISKYTELSRIDFKIERENMNVSIGDYRFDRMSFHELIKYVWRGGYPRWEKEVRPAYVTAMKDTIIRRNDGLFKDISFDT